MTIFAAIVLALTAGITEIFPVSGSGHFFLLAKLLGIPVGGELQSFRAMLCLGVGFGGVLFYRTQLLDMLREGLVLLGLHRPTTRLRGEPFGKRLGLLVLPATLPMAGALLLNGARRRLETGDLALVWVCILFCLSGAVLFFAARGARYRRTILEITLPDAILAGLAQVASVFPGLSRTGLTASALLCRGLDGGAVAEFTGLMGVPVFLASGVVQLVELDAEAQPAAAPYLILGFALSALSAFFALRVYTERITNRRPTGFAYWAWAAGILSLIVYLFSA